MRFSMTFPQQHEAVPHLIRIADVVVPIHVGGDVSLVKLGDWQESRVDTVRVGAIAGGTDNLSGLVHWGRCLPELLIDLGIPVEESQAFRRAHTHGYIALLI